MEYSNRMESIQFGQEVEEEESTCSTVAAICMPSEFTTPRSKNTSSKVLRHQEYTN
jgi:hypothetical protein